MISGGSLSKLSYHFRLAALGWDLVVAGVSSPDAGGGGGAVYSRSLGGPLLARQRVALHQQPLQ